MKQVEEVLFTPNTVKQQGKTTWYQFPSLLHGPSMKDLPVFHPPSEKASLGCWACAGGISSAELLTHSLQDQLLPETSVTHLKSCKALTQRLLHLLHQFKALQPFLNLAKKHTFDFFFFLMCMYIHAIYIYTCIPSCTYVHIYFFTFVYKYG